jgi:antitoxin component of MazEF toxin-antitoxin module
VITEIKKRGNSQGLRITREMLAELQVAVGDNVDLALRAGSLVITPARRARAGWAQAAARLAAAGEDAVGDDAATRFDATEWEWR